MAEKLKFTKAALENLPLPPPGKRYTYLDTRTPGLQVRITETGNKTFALRRRIGNGKPERVTLGRFPALTIDQARAMADQYRLALIQGQSVNATKKADLARSVTFVQVLEDYVSSRLAAGKIKQSTADSYRSMVLKGYLQKWKDRQLVSINRDEVQRLHKRISERSPAGANLAMRVARAVFNYAAGQYEDASGKPIIDVNPVQRLTATKSWNRIERRRGFIEPHDLGAWMTAVQGLAHAPEREEGTGKEHPKLRNGEIARDLLMLLLLTGLRRNEAFNLRWSDVCFQSNTLTIQDTKNREPHTLPLSDYLVTMLTERQKHSGREFVFSDTAGTRYQNPRIALERVRTSSGVEFTIHDLRRTFATVAESLDIPAYAVKALLNHKANADVTAGYIQITPERLRAPMEKITDFMLRHGGMRETGALVSLKAGANE